MSKKLAFAILRRTTAIVLLIISGIFASSIITNLWISHVDMFNILMFSIITVISLLGGVFAWGWPHWDIILGIFLIVLGSANLIEKVTMWAGDISSVAIPLIVLIGVGIFIIRRKIHFKRLTNGCTGSPTDSAPGEP
jgi:hypothetical protein